MGDKNVKKKIIIISMGLILLNPINILAKSSNTEINKFTYSKDSVMYNKKPINRPSKGTDLYIISFDEILQLHDGTRKRADAILGDIGRYYFAYATKNNKTNFLNLQYKGVDYYIPIDNSTKISKVTDLKAVQRYYTDYLDSPGDNSDFYESYYPMNEQLSNAIIKFRELNSNVDLNDKSKIWENLTKIMYDMNLEYGGGSMTQGDLSNGKTMCDGFTWIVSELLNNTNIPYRFVHRVDGYRSNSNATHMLLEVKTPDGDWKLLECTSFARNPGQSYPGYLNSIKSMLKSKSNVLSREKISYANKNEVGSIKKEYFIGKVHNSNKSNKNIKYEIVREVGYGRCIYE